MGCQRHSIACDAHSPVCLSMRWYSIAQHNILHVHDQKQFQASSSMIAACHVEDDAKMSRPCSPRSSTEQHFDAKIAY